MFSTEILLQGSINFLVATERFPQLAGFIIVLSFGLFFLIVAFKKALIIILFGKDEKDTEELLLTH